MVCSTCLKTPLYKPLHNEKAQAHGATSCYDACNSCRSKIEFYFLGRCAQQIASCDTSKKSCCAKRCKKKFAPCVQTVTYLATDKLVVALKPFQKVEWSVSLYTAAETVFRVAQCKTSLCARYMKHRLV